MNATIRRTMTLSQRRDTVDNIRNVIDLLVGSPAYQALDAKERIARLVAIVNRAGVRIAAETSEDLAWSLGALTDASLSAVECRFLDACALLIPEGA